MNAAIEYEGSRKPRSKPRSHGGIQERRIDSQHPAIAHCATRERDGERFETWCGVGTPFEPFFMNAEHAMHAHTHGTKPSPCEFCITKILEAGDA